MDTNDSMPASGNKRALVVGGGFAGVEAATDLAKQGDFDVTLVSDRDFLWLYPTSIWIPTGEIAYEGAQVEAVHSAENKVVGVAAEYAYDYLMLAIGAAKMKPQGVEHTLSIGGTPEVSLEIRDRWTLIEKGEGHIAVGFGGNPKDPSGVRGGPAFELLFNIHILLSKKRLRDEFRLTQRGHDIAAHAAGEPEREDDQAHLSILCVMDTGNGPAFVYRGRKRQLMLPLPVVGHWMKKGWGKYARLSKLGKVPHLPGM